MASPWRSCIDGKKHKRETPDGAKLETKTEMKGNRIIGTTRAPKVHAIDRECVNEGCTTQLSRYNKREYCYAHAPTRFPRLRGRIVPES